MNGISSKVIGLVEGFRVSGLSSEVLTANAWITEVLVAKRISVERT